MQAFGDQLLARASLANDENGTIEPCRTARALDAVEESARLPNKLLSPIHC